MPRGRRANRDGSTRGKFNRVTGSYRIGGLEVAFDPDLDLDSKAQPTPLFPVSHCSSPCHFEPRHALIAGRRLADESFRNTNPPAPRP